MMDFKPLKGVITLDLFYGYLCAAFRTLDKTLEFLSMPSDFVFEFPIHL